MKRYHSTRLSTDARIRMKKAHLQQDAEDERVTPDMFNSMTNARDEADESPESLDTIPENGTGETSSDYISEDMDREQADEGYFGDFVDITDEETESDAEPEHDEDDGFGDSQDIIIEEDD